MVKFRTLVYKIDLSHKNKSIQVLKLLKLAEEEAI